MVGGCMADVRAWILNHTWIDWHIRDGYGTLRRVWDAHYAKEDKSEDDRWRGYNTAQQKSDYEVEAFDDQQSDRTKTTKYICAGPSADYSSDNTQSSSSRDYYPPPRRSFYDPSPSPPQRCGESNREISRDNRLAANILHNEQMELVQITRELLRPKTDRFGRCYVGESTLRRDPPKVSPEFKLTLPEDPFNVLTTETARAPLPRRFVEEFPDQPFLQFFTWRGGFHLARCDAEHKPGPKQLPNGTAKTKSDSSAALSRCDICDRRGDKCGSIVVDAEWLDRKERDKKTLFEFIAISDAEQFTKEEFPDWTYYISKERIESEWDLYFVLLVESFPEEGIYRRVALGKVFKAAFTHSEDEWKEIILG